MSAMYGRSGRSPAEYGLVGRWVRVEGRRILGTSPGDGSLGPFFEVLERKTSFGVKKGDFNRNLMIFPVLE